MNAKQARFVAEYLVDMNATQAALRAGYSPKSADQQGFALLKHPEVREALSKAQSRQLQQAGITAQKVLDELGKLSFSNVKHLFDQVGNLKPIHLLTDEEAACIASLEVIKKNAEAGDGKIDTVHKVRVWDKTRSLEMLAKHFGLLIEKVEHGGTIVMRHEMGE